MRSPRPILVLTLMLFLAGCAGPAVPPTANAPTPAGNGTTPVPSAKPDPAYLAARIHMGHLPCGIVATPDRVWVSNYGDSTLQWIDPSTNRPSPPITVGTSPCGLALGAGSVWVENYKGNSVTRVDATTGAVQATIPVGHAPYDVTFAGGAAWATDWSDGTVSRIDAATNQRTIIHTGGNPTGIVAAGGGLWVGLAGRVQDQTTKTSYSVVRIDPATSQVTDRLDVGQRPTWTAPAGNSVWLADAGNNTVIHVDGTTRKVIDTQPVGTDTPLDGDLAAGAVWIPDKGGKLFRVDPASGKVTGSIDSGVAVPFVISGSGSTLWVVDFAGTDVVRLDLTRLP